MSDINGDKGDIFGGESGRLMREDQWEAQALAEELYAIFLTNPQLTPTKPIVATPAEGQPVMQVDGATDNSVIFRFNRADGTTQDLTPADLGATPSSGGGGTPAQPGTTTKLATVGSRTGNTYSLTTNAATTGRRIEGDVDGFDVPSGTVVLLFSVVGGTRWFSYPYPSVFQGSILSGGPGSYQVSINPMGTEAITVSVTFPGEIGPKLPAGTAVVVNRNPVDGSYFMVHPKQQVFPGTVLSGGGAGPYSVDIGETDPVNATQLQIDPADAIPAGTREIVCLGADGSYFLQVGVWVE